MTIDGTLVGRKVCNAARPEWGTGTVLSVEPATVSGQPAHRVTVQFAAGRKTVLVPPCRLIEPQPEPQRAAGWLDQLAGRSLDDRLRRLPEEVAQTLGTPRQRLAVLLPWYAFSEEPASLVAWARRMIVAADPLSHWTRDELTEAFAAFSADRDAHLRALSALLRQQEGPAALVSWVESLDPALQERIRAALARVL